MIEAIVILFADHSPVGRFKFRAVPRKGEEITVPSPKSPDGVAFYNVEEVGHLAESMDADEFNTPEIVLKVTEIT